MGFTINKGLVCFVLIFYPYLEMTFSKEACLNTAILKLIHRYPHIDRFTVRQKKNILETIQWKKPRKRNLIKD